MNRKNNNDILFKSHEIKSLIAEWEKFQQHSNRTQKQLDLANNYITAYKNVLALHGVRI